MKNKETNNEFQINEIRSLCRKMGICFWGLLVLGFVTVLFGIRISRSQDFEYKILDPVYVMDYDVSKLSDNTKNLEIKYGFQIFRNTSKYIGPENSESLKVYTGNRLACANCHLGEGTKPFAAPLIGVVQRFPQYRGREDKMGTIAERINGCLERSMNGVMMPEDSPEMKALIAYLNWLGRYAPQNGNIRGKGFVKIQIPERSVNLEHGQLIFEQHCMECHGGDGMGQKSPIGDGYQYPPLWGADSYNNGAGMTRVVTAAQFIKANMPFGATYDKPLLTDEEAYDVAGFINSKRRPEKPNRELDFPDLAKKPVSTPYGPYVDTFALQQHQFGPFQPIIKYYQEKFNINKTK